MHGFERDAHQFHHPSNFFHTEGEVLAALAGVYAGLRNTASEGEYWVFPR